MSMSPRFVYHDVGIRSTMARYCQWKWLYAQKLAATTKLQSCDALCLQAGALGAIPEEDELDDAASPAKRPKAAASANPGKATSRAADSKGAAAKPGWKG